MKPALIAPDYSAFLAEVKGRIQSARLGAARAVNRELIRLYWDIGRDIVEKQQTLGWGESVVEMLAKDLREVFPDMRGFSSRNVWDMRRLYEAYSGSAILSQAVRELGPEWANPILPQPVAETGKSQATAIVPQLVAEIPWGHHRFLLDKVTNPAARLYYLRATAQFGWSRAVLLNQIKAQAYERAKAEKKTHNFAVALPEHFAEQANEMLKSRYNLEFLGIARPMKERELEERLIGRLQNFIWNSATAFASSAGNTGWPWARRNTSWTCGSTTVS